MSAEELRRAREDEYQQRRIRQAWVAALGGRTSLAAPIFMSRTVGGVQSASIGSVSELGEIVSFHMRGTLVPDTSDPYPVVRGGAPMLLIASDSPPAGADLDVLRNGAVVETIALAFTAGLMEYQVPDVYVRGDFYNLDLTDAGIGGDGLVVVAEFRPSLT
jgi:hypothetical protein